jgi:hypothetical protein
MWSYWLALVEFSGWPVRAGSVGCIKGAVWRINWFHSRAGRLARG